MLDMGIGILLPLLTLISLIVFIIVLIKQFKHGGVLQGIIGIITCGLWTFIWGWIKHKSLAMTKLMILWTVIQLTPLVLGPVKSTLGVVCPGCGLTRAMVLFAQGHWKAAIDLHAFAPIFFGVGIFLVVGSIMPAGLQQKIAYQITAFERLTGIVGLLIIGILVYWILRIINLMNP